MFSRFGTGGVGRTDRQLATA